METEREELIPGPPGIRLPHIEISVGKWFWIGLATLVVAIGFSIAATHGWGLLTFLQPTGEVDGAYAFVTAFPRFATIYGIMHAFLGASPITMAAIVLLWIAFARPASPDRILFVPAVTLTTWVLAFLVVWIFSLFDGIGSISILLPVVFVGAASVALAARGLKPFPRAIVWVLCALAIVQQLISQFYAGDSLAMVDASLFLGMAVLAFGFEIAEQSGADLFAFEDDAEPKPAASITHLRIAWTLLLGSLGIAICIAIGFALLWGWIALPHEVGRAFAGSYADEMARMDLTRATGLATTFLGSVYLWVPIATLAVWVAFAMPTFSQRLLFASGTITGTIILIPNVVSVFQAYVLYHPHLTQLAFQSIVGYPSAGAALTVAGCASLFIGTRGLPAEWRRAAEIFCGGVLVCEVIGLLVGGVSWVYLAGGIVLGASMPILATAIARRAGIDLFAPEELVADD